MTSTPELDPITAQLRSEEARMRKRLLWLTLIPVFVAGALIWVTYDQVRKATDELDRVRTTALAKREEVDSLAAVAEAYYEELAALDSALAQRTKDRAIAALTSSRVMPRVYVHVTSDTQRTEMLKLRPLLEEIGIGVPEIEVLDSGPDESQVRFFRPEDAETARRIADLTAQVLADAGLQPREIRVRDLSARYGGAVAAGTVELWVGSRVR